MAFRYGREVQAPGAARAREFLIPAYHAYCSSTIGGNTRKYHGLVVRDGHLLLAGIDEKVNGIQISTQQYRDAGNETGLTQLLAFSAYPPEWIYTVGNALIRKTITFDGDLTVRYGITGEAGLWVRPLVTSRTVNRVLRDPAPAIVHEPDGFRWNGLFFQGDLPYRADPVTYRDVWYQREQERGYEAAEDLFSPGVFQGRVTDSIVTFRCSGATGHTWEHPRPPAQGIPGWLGRAADAFCQGDEIFAGYPWFCESWGRDSAISACGLLIDRGRRAEAQAVLRRLAGSKKNGLVPNRFPDNYHSGDATLWYIHALGKYRERWGDDAFINETKPVAGSLLAEYPFSPVARLDHDLITVAPGSTWMDTPFTPREGKPVEVNALWIHALDIAGSMGIPVPASPAAARREFQRFYNPAAQCFSDTIDPPDPRVRPNQVIALALGLAAPELAKTALKTIARTLLTPYGLRSLSPEDPGYRGQYEGDASYHNGCVWPWLTGFYCEALLGTGVPRHQVAPLLLPILSHAREAGIGYISEIFDGDFPYHPRGCIAQAWSVAEIARAYRMVFAKTYAGQLS